MSQDNRSEVRQVLLITLLLNVLVMVLKAGVGFWTGSLSLLADVGGKSGTDCGCSTPDERYLGDDDGDWRFGWMWRWCLEVAGKC